MRISRRHATARAAAAALLLSLLTMAGGAPTVTQVAYAPHGDGENRSAGTPHALSPHAFLVAAEGADGAMTSADDVTLLIQDLGTTTVTALSTPHLSSASGGGCVLSATSYLVPSAGPDASWTSADDRLYLLTELGSGNVITAIPVGYLARSGTGSPQRLSATSVVLISAGPDGSEESADDDVVLLTDLGGSNTVTRVPLPNLDTDQLSRPIPLSATSFLVSSTGPDGGWATADDVVNLFTDAGGTNARTILSTPRLMESTPGRASRVTATRAVVVSRGPDGVYFTDDDVLYLLDDLGGANTVTPITVGGIFAYSAGHATALADDVVVLAGVGPDHVDETGDDEAIIVSGLGTTNTVQKVTLGTIDEDRQSKPLRLSSSSCSIQTGGPDAKVGSTDDQVAILTDVGGANTLTYVAVPGLASGSTSTPVALSSSAMLLRTGGPDGNVGDGGDDCVTLLEDVTSTPLIDTVPTGPQISLNFEAGLVPVNLGAGRAVFQACGADGKLGAGDDDGAVILDGLSRARDLTVSKLWIKFKPTKPEKGEKFQVKGVIALDTPDLFACHDVTISIGNAAQTIPADAFTRNKKGDWKYKDKKRVNGFIQSFTYKLKNGKVTIVGKGLGTGGETTDPGYVPVVIDCDELFLGDSFAGQQKSKGIKYKAPR